jgi:hypothetical protein
MSGAGFPVLALVAGILGVLPVGATIRTAAAPREAGGPERGGLRAPFAATAALLAVLAGVVGRAASPLDPGGRRAVLIWTPRAPHR